MPLYGFYHKNQSHFTSQGEREIILKEFGEPVHVSGEVEVVLTGTARTVGGAVHQASAAHWVRSSNVNFNRRGAPVACSV